jgi:hypothetical protein
MKSVVDITSENERVLRLFSLMTDEPAKTKEQQINGIIKAFNRLVTFLDEETIKQTTNLNKLC